LLAAANLSPLLSAFALLFCALLRLCAAMIS
jgi:hypothetical protein